MEENLPGPTLSAFKKLQYDSIPLHYRKAINRFIEEEGILSVRQKGSHVFTQHPDGRATVVPVHSVETIGPGLLSKILKDVEMTKEELIKSR
jgi:predicted RNA binding protein YcfA (HicA-like mRNA interferase family)